MGKKKKGGKGKKSAPAVPSALPEEYLKNYALACKLYGCEPCACVKNGLETEEGGCNGVGATKCYDKKREEQNKKNKEGRPSLSPSLHVRSEADVQIDALRAV